MDIRPAAMAFAAATLWGLWWIPIRYLDAGGLTGAMGGMTLNAGAFLACLVWMLLRRHRLSLQPRAVLGAVLVGVAVSTYSVALNYGDVVRVILLFYLAPAWSKIIEWAFLGMPWRWTSSVALVAALSGAVLILGGDLRLDGIRAGDVLALGSGVAWAAGAAMIYTSGGASALSLSLVTALSATLLGLPFLWVDGTSLPGIAEAVPVIAGLGMGVVYVLPILALTLWSAQKLTPAVITFLLTAEILSGVISGVLLLGEPFGPMRAAGAALIVLGALSEVLPKLRPAPAEEPRR